MKIFTKNIKFLNFHKNFQIYEIFTNILAFLNSEGFFFFFHDPKTTLHASG